MKTAQLLDHRGQPVRKEYYEDYSVCANCRFNGDGIQCHKFDVEVFRAFSPGGGCCPPGSAAEELK